MSERDRKEAVPLVLLVAGAVVVWLCSRIPGLAHSLAEHAGRPATAALAMATAVLACALLTARAAAIRRALANRTRVVMLPADSFDPPAEAVVRFAAGLSRTRRAVRGALEAPGSAVRVCLDHDERGRLRYGIEAPDHARHALRAAAGNYSEVELRPAPDPPLHGGATGTMDVARAELVLGRPSTEPLRAAGLDPDPLAGIAQAFAALRPDQGEAARVCIDLLAVTPGQRRRLRRRLLRDARRHDQTAAALAQAEADLLSPSRRRERLGTAELVARRAGQLALGAKLGSPEPMFFVQVLVRAASPVAGRAQSHVQALLTAFDAFAGDNHFRVVGQRIPGLAFLGSDAPWRRGRFDRRFASGRFRPARRRLVTGSEVAGLLKPPSAKCGAPNVLRSGGVVPAPPPGLPTFRGQPDLLPLGHVTTETGERTVGVPLADTFFSYCAGRSRFGKTETAICQFLHLVRSGNGGVFLDPHQDALEKIKRYLTAPALRDRVIEINLARHSAQPGWNLFDVAGRPAAHLQERVDAVVSAIASTLRWDETNNRALNLTTQATQALVELARGLPPELAPTIFQIPTLLSDDDWRAAVLSHLAPPTREFFVRRFPRLPAEAITPVTHLIDRLRRAPSVAALLGNPISGYDIRRAMDEGKIVLLCPGGGSDLDRLLANFFVYDLLHAAKTRVDVLPERRRHFYAVLDELQAYDGAAAGNLGDLLEQTAKYGNRVLALNQDPERLSPRTLRAITTNRSHLLTTALSAKAAALLAREWGGHPDPEVITGLPRYAFLASVTLHGEIHPPFRLRGLVAHELFTDRATDADLTALEAAIDRTTRRQAISETLDALDTHDRRILDHLRQRSRRTRPARRGRPGEHTLPGTGGSK